MSQTTNIAYLLQHLGSVLAKQNDQALQERLGLGYSQFKILQVLEFNPHIQQRQIAEWLGQTEASISRQIKLMIDKGLLQSTVSPHNRREHITTSTVKGVRLNEEALKVLNITHGEMFEHLGDKKQRHMLETLSEMHQDTCQSGRVGACTHPYNA